MTKLSKWLRENLKDNVKEIFKVTIEHLLKLKPPVKKNKRQALISLLQALMKNDKSKVEEEKKDDLSSQILHKFSFSVSKQDYIPSDTVKEFALKYNLSQNIDFLDTDILYILQSFKNEVMNHHVHGITKSEEKWNDKKLQRLLIELVDCLSDEDAFSLCW
ncbi:20132_t:CDS:2 [Racocetra persica]|uniref:20132_t:CDS:1 n=1 Tax=Racocetra persica TaxID=160502 RepID=A0ACA9S382_9GLOM|nr:20132_t:CDS:2 [Racocetra persica]